MSSTNTEIVVCSGYKTYKGYKYHLNFPYIFFMVSIKTLKCPFFYSLIGSIYFCQKLIKSL